MSIQQTNSRKDVLQPACAPLLSREDQYAILERVVGFGATIKRGFDREGYERREQFSAVFLCPRCGEDVNAWSQTEEWAFGERARWIHASYGPASGSCCGLHFIDGFNGVHILGLTRDEHLRLRDEAEEDGEWFPDLDCDDPDDYDANYR